MHALTLCPERHDSCTSDNEHQLNSVRTHAKSEQQIIFMPYSVRTHAQSEQQIIFMPYSVRTHAQTQSSKSYSCPTQLRTHAQSEQQIIFRP